MIFLFPRQPWLNHEFPGYFTKAIPLIFSWKDFFSYHLGSIIIGRKNFNQPSILIEWFGVEGKWVGYFQIQNSTRLVLVRVDWNYLQGKPPRPPHHSLLMVSWSL
jgi:hypothetical protein